MSKFINAVLYFDDQEKISDLTKKEIVESKCESKIEWAWILDDNKVEKFGRSFQEEILAFYKSKCGDLSAQRLRKDRENRFLVTIRK